MSRSAGRDCSSRTNEAVSGASLRGAPAGASPNAAAARPPSETASKGVLPSLPEPRRRIDLALWAVVVEVSIVRPGHLAANAPAKRSTAGFEPAIPGSVGGPRGGARKRGFEPRGPAGRAVADRGPQDERGASGAHPPAPPCAPRVRAATLGRSREVPRPQRPWQSTACPLRAAARSRCWERWLSRRRGARRRRGHRPPCPAVTEPAPRRAPGEVTGRSGNPGRPGARVSPP
jgi:hypothetical protein